MGVDTDGNLYVVDEFCQSNLTLSEAARHVARLCKGRNVRYAVASPDLWNRRQDTGKSGFEVMQSVLGMPPMCAADNRRVPGWRLLREYLQPAPDAPVLRISSACTELCRSMPALLCDTIRPEDASDEPHAVTHAPEALRYAVMSRANLPTPQPTAHNTFRFAKKERSLF